MSIVLSDIALWWLLCSEMIDGVQNVGNDDNGCMLTTDHCSDTMVTWLTVDTSQP